jgi:hypothetical protein
MQIGVRSLAAKLSPKLNKLVHCGAVPCPIVTPKYAFRAPIGESNASLWASRAAAGKTIERIALRASMGVECKNFPELSSYISLNYSNVTSEIPVMCKINNVKIIGAADFVFTDNNGKRVLSEYKINIKQLPTKVDYLQAVLYALLYNRNCNKTTSPIDIVEWFNPVSGLQCRLTATPDSLNQPLNLEKIIAIYLSD